MAKADLRAPVDDAYGCPECGHPASDVIDSRHTQTMGRRRRRRCRQCQHRFTTYERHAFGQEEDLSLNLGLTDGAVASLRDLLRTVERAALDTNLRALQRALEPCAPASTAAVHP